MLPELEQLYPSPQNLPLTPSWGHPQAWWRRLFGQKQENKALGTLHIDTQDIQLVMPPEGTLATLAWQHPFTHQLTRWDTEHGTELSLSLRSKAAPHDAPKIQIRAMWPTGLVESDIPQKQDLAPFIDPLHFATLWKALKIVATAHSIPWKPWLLHTPSHEDCALLQSHTRAPVCVACDSARVLVLASQVYRCLHCGYEGGEGMPEHIRSLNRRAWRALPKAKLRSMQRQDLTLALEAIQSASNHTSFVLTFNGSLQGFGSAPDVATNKDDIAYGELSTCTRMILKALGHLRDAVDKDPDHQELYTYVSQQLDFIELPLEDLASRKVHEPLLRVEQHILHNLASM